MNAIFGEAIPYVEGAGAPCALLDTFSRSGAGAGTSEFGGYVYSGLNTYIATDGSRLTFVNPPGNSWQVISSVPFSYPLIFCFEFTFEAATASLNVRVLLPAGSPIGILDKAFSLNIQNNLQVQIAAVDNIGLSPIPDPATPFGAAASGPTVAFGLGTTYVMLVAIDATHMHAKWWALGDPVPVRYPIGLTSPGTPGTFNMGAVTQYAWNNTAGSPAAGVYLEVDNFCISEGLTGATGGCDSNACDPANVTGLCSDTFSRTVAETEFAPDTYGSGWGTSELYDPGCTGIDWQTGTLSSAARFSVDGSVGIMRGGSGGALANIALPLNSLPIEIEFDITLTDHVILFGGFPAFASDGVIFQIGFPPVPGGGYLFGSIDMSSSGDWFVEGGTSGFPAGDTSNTWSIGSSTIGAVGSSATIVAHVRMRVSASGCAVYITGTSSGSFSGPAWPYSTVGAFLMQGSNLTLGTPQQVTIDNFRTPCGSDTSGGGSTTQISTLDIDDPQTDPAGAYAP